MGSPLLRSRAVLDCRGEASNLDGGRPPPKRPESRPDRSGSVRGAGAVGGCYDQDNRRGPVPMRARVRVDFREPEQGGRKKPFHGSRYSTVARWDRDGHSEEWSVVIDFGKPVVAGGEPLHGGLTFLAAPPAAPIRNAFERNLREGPHLVGVARVEAVVFDTAADELETWVGAARFRADSELGRSPSPTATREMRESL